MARSQQRTVLVGIDYSETGQLALRRALSLADGGTLHVVHVIEHATPIAVPGMPIPVPPTQPALEDAAAALQRYVEEQVGATLGGTEPPNVSRVVSHLAVGIPADEVVQLASDLDADLIVVGTHGRRGVQRFMLGSIAERVVRMATCPVLVERPKATPKDEVPRIEPPCPSCAETRQRTQGSELWCAQHRERHGRRHTYHSRNTQAAFPSNHGGLGSVS